ncbi:hypothetical protein Tco_1158400, partial [Tanacetum coccineum]
MLTRSLAHFHLPEVFLEAVSLLSGLPESRGRICLHSISPIPCCGGIGYVVVVVVCCCVARGSLIIHQRLNLISIIIVLDIAQVQLNTSRNGATDFERLHQYQQTLKDDSTVSSQQNYIWKDMLTYDGDAAYDGSLQNYMYRQIQMKCFYLHNKDIQWKSRGSTVLEIRNGTSLASESSLTIAQEQKFTIREISAEWVYVTEPSKVSSLDIYKKILCALFFDQSSWLVGYSQFHTFIAA